MASRAIQIRRKPKQKKLVNDIDDFIENHHGLKSELWVDINDCFISPLKIDRKTKNPRYIEQLAEDLKTRQINAVVARENNGKYEIISGECRYEAAKLINKKLLVRVVDWSDDEAIATIISENEKREDLCDYDKARAYLEYRGKLSIRNFAEKYNLKKSQVGELFQLEKIPQTVCDALPMTKLRAKQFSDIAARISEGSAYINAFIHFSPLLLSTERTVTWKEFISRVERKVNPPKPPTQQVLERYIFKAPGVKVTSISYKDTEFKAKLKKPLTYKQKEQLQDFLEKLK
ncbi:Nucleoid occlusion protein [Piscirickettsia salmonis]|uniref:ParB/RepB/Spo0J family partition protein n=1 Tax=Piscirickettsia salmonis TaxID=1238 RepID=UPI0018ACE501|nr:ParB/RepB/Spo0J family partition protein [Piscirickettsia salmonis]QGP52028.1 Nucleoid occlusion protein [Piscirickettsia salmonis]